MRKDDSGDVNVGLHFGGGGAAVSEQAGSVAPGKEAGGGQEVSGEGISGGPVVFGFAFGGDEGVVEVFENAGGFDEVSSGAGMGGSGVAVSMGKGEDDHHVGDGAVFGRVSLCDIGSGGDEDADDFGMQTGGGDEEDGDAVFVVGIRGRARAEMGADLGEGRVRLFDFGNQPGDGGGRAKGDAHIHIVRPARDVASGVVVGSGAVARPVGQMAANRGLRSKTQ